MVEIKHELQETVSTGHGQRSKREKVEVLLFFQVVTACIFEIFSKKKRAAIAAMVATLAMAAMIAMVAIVAMQSTEANGFKHSLQYQKEQACRIGKKKNPRLKGK